MLAPQWPYPVYDMAFTYLLMKDYENARRCYRKSVSLAPRGFFTAITALDTLERELKGNLPVGTYLAYLSLEWTDDPEERAEAVRQLVERVPAFAPAWKELAVLSEDDTATARCHREGIGSEPRRRNEGHSADQQGPASGTKRRS